MYSIRKRNLQRFISVFGDVGKARPPREKLLTDFSVNFLQKRVVIVENHNLIPFQYLHLLLKLLF